MNSKITFPKLAAMLADKSGRSKRFSEDFLREFFSLISDQLEAGENVKIKGFGTFRLARVEPRRSVDVTTGQPMEIAGHTKVVFTPAKELAEAVNAPFEAFSTIEIDDNVDISDIVDNQDGVLQSDSLQPDVEDIASSSEIPVNIDNSFPLSASDNTDSPNCVEESDNIEVVDKKEVLSNSPDCQHTDLPSYNSDINETKYDEFEILDESTPAPPASVVDDWEYSNSGYERRFRVKRQWLWALVFGLGCAALGVIVTFAVWSLLTKPDLKIPEHTQNAQNANSSSAQKNVDVNAGDNQEEDFLFSDEELADMQPLDVDPVPTKPSDPVVYDTISTSRFLTTMAKAHYGNNKLWPYIYEENKDFIGHPDRIRPGTPIRIPNLSKFGIDPKNPADIEKANKLAVEIYARYGKKI